MRKRELKLWLIADSGHREAMLLMLRIIRGVSLPLIAKNQIICSKHLSISYKMPSIAIAQTDFFLVQTLTLTGVALSS